MLHLSGEAKLPLDGLGEVVRYFISWEYDDCGDRNEFFGFYPTEEDRDERLREVTEGDGENIKTWEEED